MVGWLDYLILKLVWAWIGAELANFKFPYVKTGIICSEMLKYLHFLGQTDERTDGPTDKARYRSSMLELKDYKQKFQTKFPNESSKNSFHTEQKLLIDFRCGLQTVIPLFIRMSQPMPSGFEQRHT